jgi:hypothetical protein
MGEGASKIACRSVGTPVFVGMLAASAVGIFLAPMLRRATLSDCLKLQFGMVACPAAKLRRQHRLSHDFGRSVASIWNAGIRSILHAIQTGTNSNRAGRPSR